MKPEALSPAELDELKNWIDANRKAWPESIRGLLDRMVALYVLLAAGKKHASKLLRTLQVAMGLAPSSERGTQLAKQ